MLKKFLPRRIPSRDKCMPAYFTNNVIMPEFGYAFTGKDLSRQVYQMLATTILLTAHLFPIGLNKTELVCLVLFSPQDGYQGITEKDMMQYFMFWVKACLGKQIYEKYNTYSPLHKEPHFVAIIARPFLVRGDLTIFIILSTSMLPLHSWVESEKR